MNVEDHADLAAARIASAIGEPARARMLYCLSDGRLRTSTELAAVADVTPSTASVHLQCLKSNRLVKVYAQGKHRYYSLEGHEVAAVLEALSVVAGVSGDAFAMRTPDYLRLARTCYDHIAGALGVALNDCFARTGWLVSGGHSDSAYSLTTRGAREFKWLGIDIEATRAMRRRFAFPCVDWSERRPHLGGALGAAVLHLALQRQWVVRTPGSRALEITRRGRCEMQSRFGVPSHC